MDIHALTAAMPKKRMASGALIMNRAGEVLLVNPTYRKEWLIPGGIVEQDESPIEGCKREVMEELGVSIDLGRLLSLDYMPSSSEGTEALHFVFWGGVWGDEEIRRITLCNVELSEFRFFAVAELGEYLPSALNVRLQAAIGVLEGECLAYLEGGCACY